MSGYGMTPEEVIEAKHGLAGLAEMLRAYFNELHEQGFTDEQALRIIVGWQGAMMNQWRPE